MARKRSVEMEKIGIDNLKRIIEFGIRFGNNFAVILADKKVSVPEIFQLVTLLGGITGVIESVKNVKSEIADLSEFEALQLSNYFESNFNIADDKLEKHIEKSVKLITFMVDYVNDFTDGK